MNGRGAEPPIEENEDLEYDKNSVYTHFRNKKYGCQLTGCLNGGSCIFSEVSKTFRCVCKGPWIGEYCKVNHCSGSPYANEGSCSNLVDGYKCSCIKGRFTGKLCEQGETTTYLV
ncbi:Delta-like protein 4 [Porites harrisoni]